MKLLSWFSRTQADDALPDHDGALAKQLVGEGAILLDVRTAHEFAAGSIPGSINITHVELPIRMHEVRSAQGNDRGTPIVVYCRSGARSRTAKRMLKQAGFDRVLDLGGLRNWPG